MSDVPAKTSNTAATISIGSAIVGFLVLPIILAPLAIIAGFVGTRDGPSWSATIGILGGFAEIIYMLGQWKIAGVI